MNEELKPVLNAVEWASLGPNGKGHPIMPSVVADIEYLHPENLLAAMAVANASLPDDSPYKITRADVEAVRDAWELAVDYNNHEPDNEAQVVALDRLRAKISALLPPEQP